MKKNYDLLSKRIEAINLKFGECRSLVDSFEEQFDNDDLERINKIQIINEMLNEEEENIYGKSLSEDGGEGQDIDVSHPSLEQSLQKMKKEIIMDINQLVSMFNDNNKHIKEHNKNSKTGE